MKRKLTNYLQNTTCVPGWRNPKAEVCPAEKGLRTQQGWFLKVTNLRHLLGSSAFDLAVVFHFYFQNYLCARD